MNYTVKGLLTSVLFLAGLAEASFVQAAEFTVNVNASSFSPSSRTVTQGDQITWVWTGGSHTTTHVPAQGESVLWNQNINTSNREYTRTFNTVGTFNYKCTPHGFTGVISVTQSSGILDEPGADAVPTSANLSQNSPNPFNAATQIEYSLDRDGIVQLTVFNLLGQRVATLENSFQPAGNHITIWDGRDDNGRDIPSGIYFARMTTTDVAMTRKMVLLR